MATQAAPVDVVLAMVAVRHDKSSGTRGAEGEGKDLHSGASRSRGDVARHATEHPPVERRDGPPVEMAGETARLEDGALRVRRPGAIGVDVQVQPRDTGQPHLRAQPAQVSRPDLAVAPEVDGV